MRIGLSYDLKETIAIQQASCDDAFEEYDSWETVELIAATLEAEGHTVTMLGGGREFLSKILHEKLDFVFNIAEGRGAYRSREAQVPSILAEYTLFRFRPTVSCHMPGQTFDQKAGRIRRSEHTEVAYNQ